MSDFDTKFECCDKCKRLTIHVRHDGKWLCVICSDVLSPYLQWLRERTEDLATEVAKLQKMFGKGD
jgi:ribosomal protein L37AE/L43A